MSADSLVRWLRSDSKPMEIKTVKPSLLVKAIELIDQLPLTEGDGKGDVCEYLLMKLTIAGINLMKLTIAGINGQFRTPRHVIDLIVQIVAPPANGSDC